MFCCQASACDTPTRVLRTYRDEIDRMVPGDFIWCPYEEMSRLPAYCLEAQHFWGAPLPLVCHYSVEWQRTDRVMPQFGRVQGIPEAPTPFPSIEIMREGTRLKTASAEMGHALRRWAMRNELVLQGDEWNDVQRGYLDWYYRHSVIIIGHGPGDTAEVGYAGASVQINQLAMAVKTARDTLSRYRRGEWSSTVDDLIWIVEQEPSHILTSSGMAEVLPQEATPYREDTPGRSSLSTSRSQRRRQRSSPSPSPSQRQQRSSLSSSPSQRRQRSSPSLSPSRRPVSQLPSQVSQEYGGRYVFPTPLYPYASSSFYGPPPLCPPFPGMGYPESSSSHAPPAPHPPFMQMGHPGASYSQGPLTLYQSFLHMWYLWASALHAPPPPYMPVTQMGHPGASPSQDPSLSYPSSAYDSQQPYDAYVLIMHMLFYYV